MNEELKAYFKIEAKIAAAFNFFISGMVAGIIHHKADAISMDPVSIAIDLLITCILTFTVTAFFVRMSLRNTQTVDILPAPNRLMAFLAALFDSPLGFGVLMGVVTAVILFFIIAPLFALVFHVPALPFYLYVFVKALTSLALGACVTLLEMYSGMCQPVDRKTQESLD